jgi:hypothetical protein
MSSLTHTRWQCRTALFAAAAKGFEESVVMLLDAKANPNIYNPKVSLRIGKGGVLSGVAASG